jgi:hypothetical protein
LQQKQVFSIKYAEYPGGGGADMKHVRDIARGFRMRPTNHTFFLTMISA